MSHRADTPKSLETLKVLLSNKALRRALSVSTLLTLDAVALMAGIFAASRLFERGPEEVSLLTPGLVVVWALLFAAFGLYERAPGRRSPAALAGAGLSWAGLILAGSVLYPQSGLEARWAFPGAFASLVLVVMLRLLFEGAVSRIYRRGIGQLPVLIVGGSEGRRRVRGIIERAPSAYAPVGELGFSDAAKSPDIDLSALRESLEATGARGIILVGAERLPDEEFLGLLESARLRGVVLRVVPGALSLLGGSQSENQRLYEGMGMPLLEVRYPRLDNTQRALKRTLDVATSAAGLVALSPLLFAVGLAIRLGSPGEALLGQKRAGADEKVFICYKFRSMYIDADERQAALERENDADGALFKMRLDPRVTPLGRFLRRWSIDELPQLINVLKGEMSLVGPRPLPIRDFERLGDAHKRRLAAPPGMTGYWQVRGRSDLPFEEMVRLDIYYIENWSLSFDVEIIARTLRAVLRGNGAY